MHQSEGYNSGTNNVRKHKKPYMDWNKSLDAGINILEILCLFLDLNTNEADQCFFILDEEGKKILGALYADYVKVAAKL